MKFLCVRCDEAMKIEKTEGPDEGSLSIFFQCPGCMIQVALLTNPMETQLVKSLGVKIGGAAVPSEPYEQIRGGIQGERSCMFMERASPGETGHPDRSEGAERLRQPEGSCSDEQEDLPEWSMEARARLSRVPGFVRPMVEKTILSYARQKGYRLITDTVMDEAKKATGM